MDDLGDIYVVSEDTTMDIEGVLDLEPRSLSAMSDTRPVTVYNVVEGVKELVTVLEYPYPNCPLPTCGIALSTSEEIESHYKTIHSMGTIISLKGKKGKGCTKCDKQFLNVKDLKLHDKWHHPIVVDENAKKAALKIMAALDNYGQPLRLTLGGPPIKSGLLHIDLIKRPDMLNDDYENEPAPSVIIPRKFQCYYCDDRFAVKDFCEAHIREKHYHIIRPYYCKVCGRNLATRKAYQTHLEVHLLSRKDKTTYVCDICGRDFVSDVNLRRHKILHTNKRPHLCQICGTSFMQKGSLDNHMRIHGYKDKLLCHFCCRGYKIESKLKEHVECHHRDQTIYACYICEMKHADSISLRTHYRTVHLTINRDKTFGCHLCAFMTFFPRDLRTHLQAHIRRSKCASSATCAKRASRKNKV